MKISPEFITMLSGFNPPLVCQKFIIETGALCPLKNNYEITG